MKLRLKQIRVRYNNTEQFRFIGGYYPGKPYEIFYAYEMKTEEAYLKLDMYKRLIKKLA